MRERFGNDMGGFSPVREGEEHDVRIEAVGEKGDGVAKIKGFVVFVPGVKEGDEVKIRVTKVLRKVGFGEVVGKADQKAPQEKPKEESVKEPSEEDEMLFDTSKDSEDFGEEPNLEEEPEEEVKKEKPKPKKKK
ncbi:MAG: TRAM domain-containing protein [Nanoarchaeota archaeon]|nr:TRAM domain-containing protein [Nanoarchaeota archaeon]MBU1270442.1 TRAM domain-containing protein [Nanoarchaeota archaeon]MBU1604803.1 TRAM domain-containing protein [Nanoarchaeota archaeon]MBU2443211.1 TRAM domain-containing protein [Nanoarchaeota archaeon]